MHKSATATKSKFWGRRGGAAIGMAAMTAVGAATPTRAATVTLVTSDAAGQSSFSTGTNWSTGNPPAAGNAYVVGTTLNATGGTVAGVLRTVADDTTSPTFAGDSLSISGTAALNSTLTIKNAPGSTVTVNNLTLDFGQVQNGGNSSGGATSITFAGTVTVGPDGGVFTAGAGGRILTVTAPVAGTGVLTATSAGGQLILTGANTQTAPQIILAGTTFANGASVGAVGATDGVSLPTAALLNLSGGVLQTTGTVARVAGTAAGQIQIAGVSGFSATTAASPVTVALGGAAAPAPLVWGVAPFNPTILVLNDPSALSPVTFANAIDLGTAAKTVFVGANTATLGGALTDVGGLNVYGAGTLILTNPANTFTGNTVIGSSANNAAQSVAGVVRAAASGALGTGTITIGNGGNGTTGRLELVGGITLANPISLPARTSTTAVDVESVAGANVLSGTIAVNSGGSTYTIQSDLGSTLTLSGASTVANGVALQSAGGGRTVTLSGAGAGVVTGNVRDSNAVAGATIALLKTGTGTWTLAGADTYSGATNVSAGTLAIASVGGLPTAATSTAVTIGVGATLALSATATPFTAAVSALNLSGGTDAWTSTVDVGNNGLVVRGGSLANATNQAKFGYAAGAFNGSGGIISTAAAASARRVTTVGVIANNDGAGTALYSANAPFGTVTPAPNDVLVRYTYFGDANLDGVVNGADYVRIDAGFAGQSTATPPTGWYNGDFNYDGKVDGSDYTLIDNAFNLQVRGAAPQVATATAEVAGGSAAVPEPGSAAVLAVAGGLLAGRRRVARLR